MNLGEIKRLLDAEFIIGENYEDLQIEHAFAADLMSDVLAFVGEGVVLLTGLVNPLVIRTADMVDVKAIIYVRGKRPLEEAVELARNIGIPLLTTEYIMFEACGILFKNGIKGSLSKVKKSEAS